MITMHPPENVREYLNRFLFEVADEATVRNIKQGLLKYYPDEALNVNVGYDYCGYLFVKFEFETEEDAVVFKLKHGI